MQKLLMLLVMSCAAMSCSGCASQSGGLAYTMHQTDNLVNVRLDGANDAAVAEVFGKTLISAKGVVVAKRYSSVIIPDNPQASYVIWRATVRDTDPFQLQTTIVDMVREIVKAGGVLNLEGQYYNYGRDEIAMLYGLRPGGATSREIQFVVDRELAQDREMSGW